jgi:hypothetical protein
VWEREEEEAVKVTRSSCVEWHSQVRGRLSLCGGPLGKKRRKRKK